VFNVLVDKLSMDLSRGGDIWRKMQGEDELKA